MRVTREISDPIVFDFLQNAPEEEIEMVMNLYQEKYGSGEGAEALNEEDAEEQAFDDNVREAFSSEEGQGRRVGRTEKYEHGFGCDRLYSPAQGAGPRSCRVVRPSPDLAE